MLTRELLIDATRLHEMHIGVMTCSLDRYNMLAWYPGGLFEDARVLVGIRQQAYLAMFSSAGQVQAAGASEEQSSCDAPPAGQVHVEQESWLTRPMGRRDVACPVQLCAGLLGQHIRCFNLRAVAPVGFYLGNVSRANGLYTTAIRTSTAIVANPAAAATAPALRRLPSLPQR